MTMVIDTLCPRFLCRKSKVGDILATQFYLSPQAKKKKKKNDRGPPPFKYLEMSRKRETSERHRKSGWVGKKLKH